jgi:predicted ATPase
LLDGTNFDSAFGTLKFVRTLLDKLHGNEDRKLDPNEQLRQGFSLQDVYDHIFSLDYLSPIYNLRWDGKSLEQLSPGERGNLLLIFYLLVDRDDIPLVIDQPEENLDNQTVFKTLVPCIKDAKKRRQIIIVTHNPNLAVVCDAEQIICAEIRKEHGNEVIYVAGAIEDPAINRRIVDILGGTRPAFDKRDDKYQSEGIPPHTR